MPVSSYPILDAEETQAWTPPLDRGFDPIRVEPSRARLQTMELPNGRFVLVLDNWSGLTPDPGWVDHIKEVTGAEGILTFTTPVDVY